LRHFAADQFRTWALRQLVSALPGSGETRPDHRGVRGLWGRSPSAVTSCFPGKCLVVEATTQNVRQSRREAVEVGSLPIAESQGSLVNLAERVLLCDRNVGFQETTLEQGPEVLDTVCVDDAVDVLADLVVDDTVLEVGADGRTFFDVLADEGDKGFKKATIRQTRAPSKSAGQDAPLPHARPHLTHADTDA